MTIPIRKELVDVWYDQGIESLREKSEVFNDPVARCAYLSNYIEDLERGYRIYKANRSLTPGPIDPVIRSKRRTGPLQI